MFDPPYLRCRRERDESPDVKTWRGHRAGALIAVIIGAAGSAVAWKVLTGRDEDPDDPQDGSPGTVVPGEADEPDLEL